MAAIPLRRLGAALVVATALLLGVAGSVLPQAAARSSEGHVATVVAAVDRGVAVVGEPTRSHPLVVALLGVLVTVAATAAVGRARTGSVRRLVGAATVPERRWWARKVGAPPVGWC